MLDQAGKKERLPDNDGADIVSAWEQDNSPDDLPAELKILDRMVGIWDIVNINQPAVWTPVASRTMARVKREWILDGRFILETSIADNDEESIALFGFDSGTDDYRSWWFNSEGIRNQCKGTWNEKSQTLTYVTESDDELHLHNSVRFAKPNQEVWDVKVTDADGKVYYDSHIIATRRVPANGKSDLDIQKSSRNR